MKRIALAVHAVLALLFTAVLVYLWFRMITEGDAPWTRWGRSFGLGGGVYVDLYVLLLATVLALPAAAFTLWRALQLLGVLTPSPGVRWSANLLAAMALGCLAIVALRFDFAGNISGAAQAPKISPPSDEQLEFPELPLAPEGDFHWTVRDAAGQEIDVASLQGKAVFLNIWATWCGFCILEFPNIQRLYDALKDDPNVVFLLVSDEDPETVAAWRASEEGQQYDLPFYTTDAFPARYRPSGYPTTFFIAPDGQTAFQHSGFIAWDGEKTKAFLRALGKGEN